jgi:hypothetical protein
VGLSHLLIALDGEQQGHVDRDPGSCQLLERLHARFGAGHLDQQVRPVDVSVQLLGDLHRAVNVVGDIGRQLEGDVAILAVGALIDRSQNVAGVLDVGSADPEEGLARIFYASGHGVGEGHVIAVRVAHRLLEDGRIRSDPRDPVLDESRQVAVLDEPA